LILKKSNNNIQKTFSALGMKFILSTILFIFTLSAQAQKFGYPTVDEAQLAGTKWRYSYTLHVESNTTVHQADKDYQYFLYFKFDNSYEQYLQGKFSQGKWRLFGNSINYTFRNVDKFEIAVLNNKVLALEFQQPNTHSTYQYYYVAAEDSESPFVRPQNELPEVVVLAPSKQKNKNRWWNFLSRTPERKESPTLKKEYPYMSVELIGGGFYGGIDPVVKDFTRIDTDGKLLHEFQTVNKPLEVVKHVIQKEELNAFMEFAQKNNFFNMERLYDCESTLCQKRKIQKPTPIPLRVMLNYGDRKRVITIAIYGEDAQHFRYVSYPPQLENIIEAIRKLIHRPDNRVGNQ